jgi:hypothetical protein
MRRGALLVTRELGMLAITLAGETEAVRAPAMAPTRAQSYDTTYATKTSKGVVTLWFHPRWRDSVLEVRMIVFSHSVHVSAAQLHERTRLVVDGLAWAPVSVGPWHLDAITLVFRLPRRPEHFKIVIRDVPDVPTRVLSW